MHADHQKRIRWIGNLLVCLGGILVPAVCLWFGLRSIPLGIFILVTPLVWMTPWNRLGFTLGCFYIWGLMVAVALCTATRRDVDNIAAGFVIFLGWLPYILVYGPIFGIMRIVDLCRECLTYGDLKQYVVQKPGHPEHED